MNLKSVNHSTALCGFFAMNVNEKRAAIRKATGVDVTVENARKVIRLDDDEPFILPTYKWILNMFGRYALAAMKRRPENRMDVRDRRDFKAWSEMMGY